MNLYDYGQVCALEKIGLVKEAKSRLDREVESGMLGYHDVDPSIDPKLDNTWRGRNKARGQYRENVFQPSAVDDATLARRRSLNDALFRNQHALAARGATPIQGVDPGVAVLQNRFLPGMGPATLGGGEGIFSPDTSGQFIRAAVDTPLVGPYRAAVSTYNPSFLPERKPVDSTLNRAILEHELGEAAVMRRPDQYAHASHAGIDPILRENISAQGDPEAVRALRGIRTDNDNALVARLNRQVGNHPDAPIPLGGRQQRALEGRLAANTKNLTRETRGRALGQQLVQDIMAPGTYTHHTVPQDARQAGQRVVARGKDAFKDLKNTPDVLGRLRSGAGHLREMWPDLMTMHKAIR